jgi:hypothetical protein
LRTAPHPQAAPKQNGGVAAGVGRFAPPLQQQQQRDAESVRARIAPPHFAHDELRMPAAAGDQALTGRAGGTERTGLASGVGSLDDAPESAKGIP